MDAAKRKADELDNLDNLQPSSSSSNEANISSANVVLPVQKGKRAAQPVDLAIKPEFLKPRIIEEKPREAEGQPPKKKLKGQNKRRPHVHTGDEFALCFAVSRGDTCAFGDNCKYNHDIAKYLNNKPPDLGDTCFLFNKLGRCPYGYSCRFAKAHLTEDLKLVITEKDKNLPKEDSSNYLTTEMQRQLQKRTFAFPRSQQACQELGFNWSYKHAAGGAPVDSDDQQPLEVQADQTEQPLQEPSIDQSHHSENEASSATESAALSNDVDVPLRPQERKKIDFHGKLYLAPLTTVGNLPFRRICKEFGVDITCGEMSLADNIVKAHKSEWALLRRHECEDIFGVQVAGAFPDTMMRCAEILNTMDCDFVDINMGCPIDLVFNSGYGSALLERPTRLKQIVSGMLKVLDKPLTVKLRMGVTNDHLVAHKIIPQLRDMGVVACTLHGRTKQDRYSRQADWSYISKCAEEASPLPLFGNGDVLSYEDYVNSIQNSKITGVMVARGALIKPWVFTEIKEQRIWDISASERFDMLRKFCNYGLEHFGCDTQGVNNTRRFLLEWQSFLHRYVPVGVMERPPQRMNDRTPAFIGRNDLETLMASPMSNDWVKLSEMLLGKVPADFQFAPKHKANTSELALAIEAQG